MSVSIEELKELGLEAAAGKAEKRIALKSKLMIAYENYRFVTPEIINRFKQELKAKTFEIQDPKGKWHKKPFKKSPDEVINRSIYQQTRFDGLSLIPLKEYGEAPPTEVLESLRTAQSRKVFDAYEVAKVQSYQKVEDPIIFGRINGCEDKFFVAQWDNDVSIDDILKKNEG